VDTKGILIPDIKSRDCRIQTQFIVRRQGQDGRFASFWCNPYRHLDCKCRSMDSFPKHLANEHSPEDFERQVDFVPVKSGPQMHK